MRNYGDDISKKTLRLGELRSQQERRQREEAALRELQEALSQLQGELKVSIHSRLNAGVYSSSGPEDGDSSLRTSTLPHKLLKRPGGRRTTSSRDIEPNAPIMRMKLVYKSDYTRAA